MKLTKRWKAIIWFTIFLALFFAGDFLSKYFLFQTNGLKYNVITYENPVFGIRSLPHANSTIFSAFSWKWPDWARILLNVLIGALFLIPVFFTKHIGQNIALGLMVAGILGNTVDVIFTNKGYTVPGNSGIYHYVRDIIFLPWWDTGTFNLADVWIISGAFVFAITSLYKYWIQVPKSENKIVVVK